MHGTIPGDYLKPSMTFRIELNSRTIHSTAKENTLTSTQNQQRVRKNCLENSCIGCLRSNRDCLTRECKETEGHENKEKESLEQKIVVLKVSRFVGLSMS